MRAVTVAGLVGAVLAASAPPTHGPVEPLVRVSRDAVLAPPDRPARDDLFGKAVALSGDGTRALVGGPGDDVAGSDSGTARVYVRVGTAWIEEANLPDPEREALDWFGGAVALDADGTRALIGVPGDAEHGLYSGSARVFVRSGTTWTAEASLLAADGRRPDSLGSSVALTTDATLAVVGASGALTPGGALAGSARVFARSGTTWTEQAVLFAADGVAYDQFGASVALDRDGTRVLVGAPFRTSVAELSGSAYVFVRAGSTWTLETELVADDGLRAENLGVSVDLDAEGARAIVTARGRAWIFAREGTTWAEEGVLRHPSGGGPPEWFGSAGALNAAGDLALVGVELDMGPYGGSARVFERTGTTWTYRAVLASTGTEAWFGAAVALDAAGTTALVGAPYDLVSDGFSTGTAAVFSIIPSAGLGTACAAPSDCRSGFCVDGVCCETSCGDAARDDCLACAVTAGAAADGICGARSSGAACRVAGGTCDLDEVCDGASSACPTDTWLAAGVSCRNSSDPSCDPVETCDGASAVCPPDATSCVSPMDGGPERDAGAAADGDTGERRDARADDGDAGADAGRRWRAAGGGCGCSAREQHFSLGRIAVSALALLVAARAHRARHT